VATRSTTLNHSTVGSGSVNRRLSGKREAPGAHFDGADDRAAVRDAATPAFSQDDEGLRGAGRVAVTLPTRRSTTKRFSTSHTPSKSGPWPVFIAAITTSSGFGICGRSCGLSGRTEAVGRILETVSRASNRETDGYGGERRQWTSGGAVGLLSSRTSEPGCPAWLNLGSRSSPGCESRSALSEASRKASRESNRRRPRPRWARSLIPRGKHGR
jgi:hypothetical protein